MAKYAGPEIRCCVSGLPNSELHHIYTRKSRPDLSEALWNCIPLTHSIHHEWHLKGALHMTNKYPKIKQWMLTTGWEFDAFRLKWCHPCAMHPESSAL